MTILYVVCAVLWGTFAGLFNCFLYGAKAKPWLGFLLNTLLFPLALCVAVVCAWKLRDLSLTSSSPLQGATVRQHLAVARWPRMMCGSAELLQASNPDEAVELQSRLGGRVVQVYEFKIWQLHGDYDKTAKQTSRTVNQ